MVPKEGKIETHSKLKKYKCDQNELLFLLLYWQIWKHLLILIIAKDVGKRPLAYTTGQSMNGAIFWKATGNIP